MVFDQKKKKQKKKERKNRKERKILTLAVPILART
jgi:hypothetical protein